MGLTRVAIQRPIVLLMAIAAILLLGLRARLDLPAELDPRVDMPVVNVVAIFRGAGPREVEERLSKPLEDAAATVSNVVGVSSRSLENVSFVTVRFKLGTNLNAAVADVRARVEAISAELPDGVPPPQVAKFDFNARPVMVLGCTGSRSLGNLRHLVDDTIKPRLSQVPGLGAVTVVGGEQREIQVSADPGRLAAFGLTLLDLLGPMTSASKSVPAGSIQQGDRDVAVRVLGEFRSLEDLRNTPIPLSAPLNLIDPRRGATASYAARISDLATVKDAVADRSEITRVGGRDSVGIILTRLSDANTVRVAEGVRAALADLVRRLPTDVRLSILQDHSQTVSDALDDINLSLLLGALLAVTVVYVFLHSVKDTLIVACAIPTSIVATFLVMYFAGFSLNQMTMLALSLSVGILVDDSILVLECIHRHRAMGKNNFDAALDGRQEIGLADAANTFVDVVVFVPIAFMGGIVGQFFRQFGLTIATATLASLYVSFSLTPMLAARWFRPGESVTPPVSGFGAWFDRHYQRLESSYRRLLGWALRHRALVAFTGFGSLSVVALLAWGLLGFDFTPSVDRGEINVQVEMPAGASLEATDRVMKLVEVEAAHIPEVAASRMLCTVGEVVGGFGSLPDRGAQLGQLTITLIGKQGFLDRLLHPFGQTGRRKRSDERVAADLRSRLERLPGPDRLTVNAARGLTDALAPIELALYGSDLGELGRVSAQIYAGLTSLRELENVDTTQREGKPELQVTLDRERSGDQLVSSAELSGILRTAIVGNTDLRIRRGDQSLPIRVQLARTGSGSTRHGADAIKGLVVAHHGPTTVYVGDVADVRWGSGPTRILRSNRMRQVVISAHPRPGVSLGTAEASIKKALNGVDLGGIDLKWEGDVNEMEDSAWAMASSLLLAVLLSYMLMAALFNSLIHPLTIMTSVPMALVGGLLGLIYTGTTLNIVSMIGVVMLVGLVGKNAILLVDYTNTLRRNGMKREAALQTAGPVRLRPILMTTLATVIGMAPVALQIGRASEMRAPMAIVVIGGLLLSTLLTLLVIPVMYSFFDDLSTAISRTWRRRTGGDPTVVDAAVSADCEG